MVVLSHRRGSAALYPRVGQRAAQTRPQRSRADHHHHHGAGRQRHAHLHRRPDSQHHLQALLRRTPHQRVGGVCPSPPAGLGDPRPSARRHALFLRGVAEQRVGDSVGSVGRAAAVVAAVGAGPVLRWPVLGGGVAPALDGARAADLSPDRGGLDADRGGRGVGTAARAQDPGLLDRLCNPLRADRLQRSELLFPGLGASAHLAGLDRFPHPPRPGCPSAAVLPGLGVYVSGPAGHFVQRLVLPPALLGATGPDQSTGGFQCARRPVCVRRDALVLAVLGGLCSDGRGEFVDGAEAPRGRVGHRAGPRRAD